MKANKIELYRNLLRVNTWEESADLESNVTIQMSDLTFLTFLMCDMCI